MSYREMNPWERITVHRLRVVSNFGDGDCGAAKYTRTHEISRRSGACKSSSLGLPGRFKCQPFFRWPHGMEGLGTRMAHGYYGERLAATWLLAGGYFHARVRLFGRIHHTLHFSRVDVIQVLIAPMKLELNRSKSAQHSRLQSSSVPARQVRKRKHWGREWSAQQRRLRCGSKRRASWVLMNAGPNNLDRFDRSCLLRQRYGNPALKCDSTLPVIISWDTFSA